MCIRIWQCSIKCVSEFGSVAGSVYLNLAVESECVSVPVSVSESYSVAVSVYLNMAK